MHELNTTMGAVSYTRTWAYTTNFVRPGYYNHCRVLLAKARRCLPASSATLTAQIQPEGCARKCSRKTALKWIRIVTNLTLTGLT